MDKLRYSGTSSDMEIMLDTSTQIKQEAPTEPVGVKTNRTTFYAKIAVDITEQKPWRHVIWQHEQPTYMSKKAGCELRYSGIVSSSCSTSGTIRVNLVTNSVLSNKWKKNRLETTKNGTYAWSYKLHVFNLYSKNDKERLNVNMLRKIVGSLYLLIRTMMKKSKC